MGGLVRRAATRRCRGCCSRATTRGTCASSGAAVPSDEVATTRFRGLAEAFPGRISVAPSALGPTVSWPGDVVATSELSASSFDRDARLVVAADVVQRHHGRHLRAARGERAGGARRRRRGVRAARASGRGRGPGGAALGALAAGRDAGRHRGRDARAPRLRVARLRCRRSLLRARLSRSPPHRRGGGSSSATSTRSSRASARRSRRRSGRPASSLRDVTRADRLDELNFELPLVGGDDPSGPALTLAAIADVLRRHSPPGDPLAGYAERLLDPRLRASVRGYLTGSIDLVLRLDGERFAVVDYKTNWLAPPGEDLTAWHHRPAALQRRDDALPLRAAGAALRRRAAPLPALAPAGLLRRAQPRRRPVPVRARNDRFRYAGGRRRRRAACSPGSRRPRSSRR